MKKREIMLSVLIVLTLQYVTWNWSFLTGRFWLNKTAQLGSVNACELYEQLL